MGLGDNPIVGSIQGGSTASTETLAGGVAMALHVVHYWLLGGLVSYHAWGPLNSSSDYSY